MYRTRVEGRLLQRKLLDMGASAVFRQRLIATFFWQAGQPLAQFRRCVALARSTRASEDSEGIHGAVEARNGAVLCCAVLCCAVCLVSVGRCGWSGLCSVMVADDRCLSV